MTPKYCVIVYSQVKREWMLDFVTNVLEEAQDYADCHDGTVFVNMEKP